MIVVSVLKGSSGRMRLVKLALKNRLRMEQNVSVSMVILCQRILVKNVIVRQFSMKRQKNVFVKKVSLAILITVINVIELV